MTHMREDRSIMCVLVAVTLVMGTLPSGSTLAASAVNRRKIVMFDNPPIQEVFNLLQGAGITVLYNLSLIDALAVQLPPPPLIGPDLVLALLQDLPDVQGVYDDVLTLVDPVCPTTALPSTPESYRWGPKQIEVPAAHQKWPNREGSADVTVAVLDTGIQSHSELNGRTAPGYNAIVETGPPTDGHGHGTHMAGIIVAAKNQLGIIGLTGVEPKINVAAVKVLDDTGVGYLSGVINGLQWAHNNDLPLVNMSFGFSFSKESDGTPLRKAIQTLYEAGMTMVASAGNRCPASTANEDGGGDGCYGGPAASCEVPLTAVTYPAAYGAWVIAVGATDIGNQVAAYSLSGPQLAVVAPGGEPDSRDPDNGQILSTNTGGVYGLGHGTSQAAAHVTGAAALALQLQPDLLPAEVRNLLQKTATDLGDPTDEQGAGQINVRKVIEELLL